MPLPDCLPIGNYRIPYRLSPVFDSYTYLISHWHDGFPNGKAGIVLTIGVMFIIQLAIVTTLSVIINRNLMIIMGKIKSKSIDRHRTSESRGTA